MNNVYSYSVLPGPINSCNFGSKSLLGDAKHVIRWTIDSNRAFVKTTDRQIISVSVFPFGSKHCVHYHRVWKGFSAFLSRPSLRIDDYLQPLATVFIYWKPQNKHWNSCTLE